MAREHRTKKAAGPAAGQQAVAAKACRYPLKPESVGEDTYVIISRGHHDIHAFMTEVRKVWDWPLGVPEHVWMKTMPPRDGYVSWHEPVPPGTRGAWPCTYVQEAYNEDSYEAHFEGRSATRKGADHA